MDFGNRLSGDDVLQVMLPMRITEGIVVRRIMLGDVSTIASNVPPLRHDSRTGFDFGSNGPGASDLALACVHEVLSRMDYVGPVRKTWDGSRVFELAFTLHVHFGRRFIEAAGEDQLSIPWNQALGWMRRTLLETVREEGMTQADLLDGLRRMQDAIPEPLPHTEIDMAALNRQVRDASIALAGQASVMCQYLGMIA